MLFRSLEVFLADLHSQGHEKERAEAMNTLPVAEVECQLAEALRGTPGKEGRMHDLLRSAAARLEARVRTGDMPAVLLLSRIRWRQGDLKSARQLLQRVEASNYRHPVYAELVNLMAQETGRAGNSTQRR